MKQIITLGMLIMLLTGTLTNISNAKDNPYYQNKEETQSTISDNAYQNKYNQKKQGEQKKSLPKQTYIQLGVGHGHYDAKMRIINKYGDYVYDKYKTDLNTISMEFGFWNFGIETMLGEEDFKYIGFNWYIYNFIIGNKKNIISPILGIGYWVLPFPKKTDNNESVINTEANSFNVTFGAQYRYVFNIHNSVVAKIFGLKGESNTADYHFSLGYRYVFNEVKEKRISNTKDSNKKNQYAQESKE